MRPETTSVGAVIVAAGSSSRMRGTDKLWADLFGRPLLARAIQAFEDCSEIERIVVVTSEGYGSRVREMVSASGFTKVVAVCSGGATRQESVFEGLKSLGECGLVVVHDGARPLVTPGLVDSGLDLARKRGAALCAVPAKNTIKVVDEGRVVSTPPRETLWEAQTPQVFRYGELLGAHARMAGTGLPYTDDAALMEAAGHAVWVYEGSYRNVKVTTPEDLSVVRALYGGKG